MLRTNLRKVGGSVMLAVPPALLELLQLQPGSRVAVSVEHGRLVIEPRHRPHYTMEELLAQCAHKGRRTRAEREWISGKPVGRELI